MQQTTLVQTLQLFSPQELEEAEAFFESPFFNNGKHANSLLRLFRLLRDILLAPERDIPDPETVAALLSENGSPVSTKYLSNLNTELLSLLRKYISSRMISDNWGSAFEDLMIARFYQEKGRIKMKEKALKRARRTLKRKPPPLEEKPLLDYWLEEEYMRMEQFRNNRQGELNLPQTIGALNIYYATQLLEKALSEMQQKRVFSNYYSEWTPWLEQMRGLFRAQNYFKVPAIKLMDEIMLVYESSEPPKPQIERFLANLRTHRGSISVSLLKILSSYARNFCTWKCNEGHMELRELRFDLYKQHLKEGWLYFDNKLSASVFLNLITISIWEKDFDWLKTFIDEQKSQLAAQEREKLAQFGYASYHLACGELDKSEAHLNEMLNLPKFSDVNLNSLAYTLDIKVRYNQDSPLLESKLDSYRVYLNRNRSYYDERNRKRKNRFIKYVREMSELRQDIELRRLSPQQLQLRRAQLQNRLSRRIPVAERNWLLEEAKKL